MQQDECVGRNRSKIGPTNNNLAGFVAASTASSPRIMAKNTRSFASARPRLRARRSFATFGTLTFSIAAEGCRSPKPLGSFGGSWREQFSSASFGVSAKRSAAILLFEPFAEKLLLTRFDFVALLPDLVWVPLLALG